MRFLQGTLYTLTLGVAHAFVGMPQPAAAQQGVAVPPPITTSARVETRLGTIEFTDGLPNQETLEKSYDHVDFTHATPAFADTLQGVSIHAIRRGCKRLA